MEQDSDFDPSPYLRLPQMDVATAFALVAALVAAAPSKHPEGVSRTLDALQESTTALQHAARQHAIAREKVPADPRVADVAMDRAWAAMVRRIEGFTALPETRTPDVARARQVLLVIAPDGLAVLKSSYRVQWSKLKTRLDDVEARGMEADLRALAGDAFVDEVRDCFEVYGEAIGITAPAEFDTSLPNLLEHMRTVAQRLQAYVIQVIAMANPEKPATVKAARVALKPIDDLRASQRRAAQQATPALPQNPSRPSAAPAPT